MAPNEINTSNSRKPGASAPDRHWTIPLLNDLFLTWIFSGDEDVEEVPKRDGTEENSLESDEEKRVEVSFDNNIVCYFIFKHFH